MVAASSKGGAQGQRSMLSQSVAKNPNPPPETKDAPTTPEQEAPWTDFDIRHVGQSLAALVERGLVPDPAELAAYLRKERRRPLPPPIAEYLASRIERGWKLGRGRPRKSRKANYLRWMQIMSLLVEYTMDERREENTGDPYLGAIEEVADKFGVSEATVVRTIATYKRKGHSKRRRTP
jgi:hypothetical protein